MMKFEAHIMHYDHLDVMDQEVAKFAHSSETVYPNHCSDFTHFTQENLELDWLDDGLQNEK